MAIPTRMPTQLGVVFPTTENNPLSATKHQHVGLFEDGT